MYSKKKINLHFKEIITLTITMLKIKISKIKLCKIK